MTSQSPIPAEPEDFHQDIKNLCDELAFMLNSHLEPISTVIDAAQSLASQILLHYITLKDVSRALSPFCEQNEKLPKGVLTTFVLAAIQHRKGLGLILDELHYLYGEHPNPRELSTISEIVTDRRMLEVATPLLWDGENNLRYNPAAFALIHRHEFGFEVDRYFRKGARGVRKILGDYKLMDQTSRQLMDKELTARVYKGLVNEDAPVRKLLASRLDGVAEAHIKLEQLFDCEISNDPDDHFLARLENTFALIDGLPGRSATEALVKLGEIITEWIEESQELTNDYEPLQCLVKVLNRAKVHGFDALGIIARHLSQQSVDKAFVVSLLDNIEPDPAYQNQGSYWMEAALITADEDQLIALDLDEHHLAWLFGVTASDKYRKQLQKTDIGRDIAFSQDLGL